MAEHNVLEPPSKVDNVQNDRNDPLVRSFLDFETRAALDNKRQLKMRGNQENRHLKEQIHDLLAGSRKLRRFKNTFLIQTSRRFTEEGNRMPKPFAKSSAPQKLTGHFAEALLEQQYDWSDLYTTYQNVFEATKTDGMAFIHLGFRGNDVTFDRKELADVIFDPHCTSFNADPTGSDGPGWVIIKYDYTLSKGLEVARKLTGEDWEGRIMPGEPSVTDDQFAKVTDLMAKEEAMPSQESIGFRFAYHIQKDKFVVYAGASATKLIEKAIPFRPRNRRGEKTPRVPLIAVEFSKEKLGPYPAGLYDLVKDVAEEYRDALDKGFLHFKKSVNPFIFLFTDAGEEILDQMRIAEQNQDLGSPPIILAPTGENTRMETLAPRSIAQELRDLRELAIEELASRLGMNLRQQEIVEQTATEFIRKNEFENQAIANTNEINKGSMAKLANYTIDMMLEFSDRNIKDEVMVSIQTDDGKIDVIAFEFGKALTVLDDWRGRFEVDTNIKLPTTNTEKLQILNDVQSRIDEDVQNQLITDIEQVRAKIDTLYEKLRLGDLEEILTRDTLENVYKSIIARNTQQAQNEEAEETPGEVAAGGGGIPTAPGEAPPEDLTAFRT